MSNLFTLSGLNGGEIGDSEEGLVDRVQDREPPLPDDRILVHDHHGLEERVDRRPKAQSVLQGGAIIRLIGLKVGLHGLPGHFRLQV